MCNTTYTQHQQKGTLMEYYLKKHWDGRYAWYHGDIFWKLYDNIEEAQQYANIFGIQLNIEETKEMSQTLTEAQIKKICELHCIPTKEGKNGLEMLDDYLTIDNVSIKEWIPAIYDLKKLETWLGY